MDHAWCFAPGEAHFNEPSPTSTPLEVQSRRTPDPSKDPPFVRILEILSRLINTSEDIARLSPCKHSIHSRTAWLPLSLSLERPSHPSSPEERLRAWVLPIHLLHDTYPFSPVHIPVQMMQALWGRVRARACGLGWHGRACLARLEDWKAAASSRSTCCCSASRSSSTPSSTSPTSASSAARSRPTPSAPSPRSSSCCFTTCLHHNTSLLLRVTELVSDC